MHIYLVTGPTTCNMTFQLLGFPLLEDVVMRDILVEHEPLNRYAKLGMPGTFSPPPRVSDIDMHHGTCVTHVPWYMTGLLASSFLWSRRCEKGSRHSRRMRNPQFCVSDKRAIAGVLWIKCGRRVTTCMHWIWCYIYRPTHFDSVVSHLYHWFRNIWW